MSVVLAPKNESVLSSSHLVRATKHYFDTSEGLRDAMVMGIAPAEVNWLFRQVLSQELPQAFPLVWMQARQLPEWEEWCHLCFVEDDATCHMTWTWLNKGEQENSCLLRVDLRRPIPTTLGFSIVLRHWDHLVNVISQTGTFSMILGLPVPWRTFIHTLAPAELLALIQQQSKGMVTFVMSQETTAQLRQYYKAYTARLLQDGQHIL